MSDSQNHKKGKEKDLVKRTVTSASQDKARRAARQANANARKNAKVVPARAEEKKAPETPKEAVHKVAGVLHPDSDLARWADILSNPFGHEGIFCPVSYNPAPSFIQSTARTSHTNLNVAVAMTSTTQIALWPGHSTMVGDPSQGGGVQGPMDAVAYHSRDVYIGGAASANVYTIGPMTKVDAIGTRAGVAGVLTPNVVVGGMNSASNAAGRVPLTWDVPLPYSVDSTKGGHHARWQLVAMGIRIHNVTPEIYRGGTVVTVQPNNQYLVDSAARQESLEIFPTFRDHGVGESVVVSWIPRAQDLAFWHAQESASSGGAPMASVEAPGILVFLNNPTNNTMTYSYEVVCHWQLAGTYLNPVGGPAPHAPEVKPHVEKAISFLQNSSHTAAPAKQVIARAVAHNGATSAGTWQDAARMGFTMKNAMGFAKKVGGMVTF